MKKELLNDAVGKIDDRILDRYRQMDLRLAYKHAQKKRALRVMAVAACLALLIGACVPVGMMIAQLAGGPSPVIPGTSEELTTAEPGEDTTLDPGVSDPPKSEPSISLRSMQALAEMRAMIECEDEEQLGRYLNSVEGGGARNRQDLIDFVALVDNTPCAWLLQGDVTHLSHQKGTSVDTGEPYEIFYVSVESENGEWVRLEYKLSVEDVAAHMDALRQKIGEANLLSSPISTADGRLTLHIETREPHLSGTGDLITWQGEMDGIALAIVYYVPDADAVNTAALLQELRVTESVDVSYLYPRFDKADTIFDAFVEQPGYEIYDTTNEYFGRVDDAWMSTPYVDETAQPTIRITHQGVEYTLEYQNSLPATYRQQARHQYQSAENDGTSASLDAATGALVSFTLSYMRETPGAGAEPIGIEQVEQVAKDFLATQVKDPEAYRMNVEPWANGGAYVFFWRDLGEVMSYDYVMMMISPYGEIEFYTLDYLGSMRYAPEIPESVMQSVMASMEAMVGEDAQSTCTVKAVALTPSGQLALDCEAIATYIDANGSERSSSASVLFYLTEEYIPKEPDGGNDVEPEPDVSNTDSSYANMEFGAFVTTHDYVIFSASTGEFKSEQLKGKDIQWEMVQGEPYKDATAPTTRTVTYEGQQYVLYYIHSRTETILQQKRHLYSWSDDDFEINASFDAVNGALTSFYVYRPGEEQETDPVDVEQWETAYELVKTLVSDPEAYQRGSRKVSPGYYVEYQFTRCVGDFRTNDSIYVTFYAPNWQEIGTYSLGYVGAMRGMEPLPESVMQTLKQTLDGYMLHPEDNYFFGDLYMLPDGRLAMECVVEVHYTQEVDGEEVLRSEQAWMLFYLTEPIK